MPELGGRALVEALRADGTMVPALYVSGYAAGADKATLGPYDQFVEKPFTTESLLGALQRLLVQTA
jgi:CheY-like chemotaxis protein